MSGDSLGQFRLEIFPRSFGSQAFVCVSYFDKLAGHKSVHCIVSQCAPLSCMGIIMSLQGFQLHDDSELQEEIWIILSSYQIEFLVAIEFIILSVLKVNTLRHLFAGVCAPI